jgi:EpsD family peptidyl-prolyl cis-trans isomerase
MKQKQKLFLLIAAFGLAVSGCGEKKSEPISTSKAALKINGEPVLVSELQAKSMQHGAADGNLKPVSAQAMESMVSMELMRQAAIQEKLDSNESIQAKLAISMRSILAMAYMERLLETVKKPTDAEVSAYYTQHPERYSARKQYAVQEFQIQTTPDNVPAILEQLGKLNKVDLFEKWLRENNVAHQNTPISVMTDGMPEDVLQKFKNLAVGNHIVLNEKEPLRILFIMSEQVQPAALDQASQQISNSLFEQRRKERLESTLKQLRDKAKIEYVAPYSVQGLQAGKPN